MATTGTIEPVLAIHGGAGAILRGDMSADMEQEYLHALNMALEAGYAMLIKGATSVESVAAAVVSLEDCPLFNAGKGSVFNNLGKHEMDAAIMNGSGLFAGAVSNISGIKNPVLLAKAVMEKSEHVLLSGDGAMKFANENGFELKEDDYFFVDYRHQQWLEVKNSDTFHLDHKSLDGGKKFGTVGAVALDMHGNLASATSTGGMTNKKYGRIGDTPLIGAGTYADNTSCAVSCTGHGEVFIRAVVAHELSSLMKYSGMSLSDAADQVVNKKLVQMNGEGGLIAVDSSGNITMPFNSHGMYRAAVYKDGTRFVGIYR